MTTVIAGGGIAGAAAACLLGPEALLIEREAGPHDKICGEFISVEAARDLRRLGLDLPAMGAVPIHWVRLVHGGQCARAALPFTAFGLSRRVLDEALLARAAANGARVLRGHAVRRYEAGAVHVDGLGRIATPRLLLATGKHDLRGVAREPPDVPEPLVGLKMHLALHPAQQAALAGHVEIVLFRGGYAGLQMVEGGVANLCLLVRRERFEAAGGQWDGMQRALECECPHLARRLAGAVPRLARPVTIFQVPYGFVHRPGADDPPCVFRLGDQDAVIPSFCGDGMAIALHTAFAAASAAEPAEYHRRMRRALLPQIGRAGQLYRLAMAAPGLVAAAARAWPGALQVIARMTRVPGYAASAPPR